MDAVNQTACVIDDVPALATPGARAAASALERYPDGVIEEVSPRDHMFRVRERYLRVRAERRSIASGWAWSRPGRPTVASALDLPSGHGRVLRWIKAEFPDARLGAGDIDHDGVDFCAATFGATPVYGREDPADVEIDDPVRADLVRIAVHAPARRSAGRASWPCSSARSRPEGLLVFTTHGRRIAERMRDPERRPGT